LHALGFKEILRAAAGHGVAASGVATSAGQAGDEAGRDAVFFGDESVGGLGERDNEHRVGLDLDLQVGQIRVM
jgi:hypothetical protein